MCQKSVTDLTSLDDEMPSAKNGLGSCPYCFAYVFCHRLKKCVTYICFIQGHVRVVKNHKFVCRISVISRCLLEQSVGKVSVIFTSCVYTENQANIKNSKKSKTAPKRSNAGGSYAACLIRSLMAQQQSKDTSSSSDSEEDISKDHSETQANPETLEVLLVSVIQRKICLKITQRLKLTLRHLKVLLVMNCVLCVDSEKKMTMKEISGWSVTSAPTGSISGVSQIIIRTKKVMKNLCALFV